MVMFHHSLVWRLWLEYSGHGVDGEIYKWVVHTKIGLTAMRIELPWRILACKQAVG